ncbi:MAG TPA: hypothetical protein PKE54_08685 [Candidatus Obscuribacter sp.]|nr:hypothetical protein [Candidatus Obscuribacter sp.]
MVDDNMNHIDFQSDNLGQVEASPPLFVGLYIDAIDTTGRQVVNSF